MRERAEIQIPFVAGAVVYAKDVERVGHFYSQVAGLPVVHREQGFQVLQSAACQLVVVATAPAIAAQITVESPPVRREDTAVKLCLAVSSIEVARAVAAKCGGELNGPQGEWEFQGDPVCDGHDPEGNVIQVRASVL